MRARSRERLLHALLVGVDHYPRRLGSIGPTYPDLSGCVADVGRVERYLREIVGVADERIERRVSPLPLDRERGSETPARPDYESLVAALERLGSTARRGEQVLVYYAGHGGRVPTVVPEVKGRAGLDECLVPWNVADPAARYLRDVELAAWLERMERRGVFVTLILDCCHSGGAARRRLRIRGIDTVDRTVRRSDSALADAAELSAAARRRVEVARHLQLPAHRRFSPTGYALLAACRPGERTVEEPRPDGLPGGAFTGSLLRALDDLAGHGTYEDLLDAVTCEVHSRFPTQSPMLEGESRRRWLAGRHRPRPAGIEILGRGAAERSVRLATGAAHGLGEGAMLVAAGGGSPVGLRITVSGAVTSEAKITAGTVGDRETLGPGDRVVPVDLGPGVTRVGVHVPEPAGRPAAVAELLGRLREELGRRAIWVAPVDGGGERLSVVVRGERVVVADSGRRELPATGPPLAAGAPGTLSELTRRLDHLGRWEWVRSLENREPAAALTGRIAAGLRRPPPGWRPGDRLEPAKLGDLAPDPTTGDRLSAAAGERIVLDVGNRSPHELNVAVLDLRPDWSIVQAFPAWYGGRFQPVDAGAVAAVPFGGSLPDGMDRGTDVLLVLATSDPASHRWLAMPPLAGATADGRQTRAIPPERGGELPPASAAEGAGDWIGDEGIDGWVTARVEVEITRRPHGPSSARARRRGPAENR